jgi:hypothetical protein
MEVLTRTQLRDRLMQERGATAITIVSTTEPRFRKSLDGQANPFLGVCHKRSHVNGMMNWRYGNAVNNQRMREGQPLDDAGEVEFFEPEPRKWGVRLSRTDGSITPLVEHKGRYYLELRVGKSLGYRYECQDGTTPDNETIHPWLQSRGEEGRRQQVDKPVILRDYALDSIDFITLHGETIQIVDDATPAVVF